MSCDGVSYGGMVLRSREGLFGGGSAVGCCFGAFGVVWCCCLAVFVLGAVVDATAMTVWVSRRQVEVGWNGGLRRGSGIFVSSDLVYLDRFRNWDWLLG